MSVSGEQKTRQALDQPVDRMFTWFTYIRKHNGSHAGYIRKSRLYIALPTHEVGEMMSTQCTEGYS